MATEKSSKAEDNKSAIHIIEDDAENTTSSSDANLLTSNLPMVLSGTGFPWDNKWTHSATRTLLELYVKNEEKFKDPHTKKKQIWGEISEILRSKGFTFDAEKCERKFLNLKTVYRNNVQHNCMTGNHDRKCSFYEELDAIFHLSKKLNSSKKSDSKLPDVVEPKRTAHRNPSTDTVTSSAKAAPVPVMLIPNNGGKVSNEAEKSLTSGLSPTSVSSPHNPRVSINPLASGHAINYQVKFHANFPKRNQFLSQRFPKSMPNNPTNRQAAPEPPNRTQPVQNIPPSGTAVIDLCSETTDSSKRGLSESEARSEQSASKKRRASDLQSLLESFENYRREQREREDQRMRQMKEMHDDEMKVTNRFLDIIHQYVQNGSS